MFRHDIQDFPFTPGAIPNPSTPNRENTNENSQENNQERANANGINMADKEKNSHNANGWNDILGNGELKMKLISRGEPDTRPQNSDICWIKLVGELDDGRTVDEYDNLRIQIGDHEVVQGLELILPLMDVGEKSTVVVSPRFAYGSQGNPPDIPPNATIKYTINLLSVSMEIPLENIPFDERMTLALSKRARGNWWYTRKDSLKAVQCYKKAVDLLDEAIPFVGPDGNDILNTPQNNLIVVRERIKCYNNLAAAQLVLEAYDSAMLSLIEVLKHEPYNVKALYRKSKILVATGFIEDAVTTLKQTLALEPKNTAVLSEYNKVTKMLETVKRDEKNLYRKMFGQATLDEEALKKSVPKPSRRTWRIWGPAITAVVMAAVAGVVGYKFKNYPIL